MWLALWRDSIFCCSIWEGKFDLRCDKIVPTRITKRMSPNEIFVLIMIYTSTKIKLPVGRNSILGFGDPHSHLSAHISPWAHRNYITNNAHKLDIHKQEIRRASLVRNDTRAARRSVRALAVSVRDSNASQHSTFEWSNHGRKPCSLRRKRSGSRHW